MYHVDISEWRSIASDCQKRPDPAAPLQRRVGLLNRSSMAFSSIKRAALQHEIPVVCGICGTAQLNRHVCIAVFAPALFRRRDANGSRCAMNCQYARVEVRGSM